MEGDFEIFETAGSAGYVASGASFCGPPCPENGTNYYLSQYGGFIIDRTDGAAFSLTGFDGAEAHMDRESLWADQILVTGTLLDNSTVSAGFILDEVQDATGPLNDFQTFLTTTFGSVVSLRFDGLQDDGSRDGWFSLDNIVLGDAVDTTPVPLPAGMPLMLAGMAAFGAARRLNRTR